MNNDMQEQNYGKFSKEVIVKDGKSSVVLKLWSDNQEELNRWNENDFEIMLILKNESFDDAYEKKYSEKDFKREELIDDDNDVEEVIEPTVSVMIIKKELANNVKNVALTILQKSDKGWDYPPALLSSEKQRKRTATIRGFKWWTRAYYGVDVKADKDAAWTTKVAQWQQIKKGETHSPYSDCYQMRVWRKYKNSDAITVAFDD